jgi:hypothetical protein
MKKPYKLKKAPISVREKAEKDLERLEDFRKRQHDNYRQDRQFYVDSDERSSALFDKSIITISSGAFGLTATLVSTTFKNPIANSVHFLEWSLWGFGLSIFVIVVNYIVGHFSIERQINLLDTHQIEIGKDPNKMAEKCPDTQLRNTVLALNIISLLLFGVGAGLLVQFIVLNLGG